jgi:hypothetical protein
LCGKVYDIKLNRNLLSHVWACLKRTAGIKHSLYFWKCLHSSGIVCHDKIQNLQEFIYSKNMHKIYKQLVPVLCGEIVDNYEDA